MPPNASRDARAFLATIIGRQRDLPAVLRFRAALRDGRPVAEVDQLLRDARQATRRQAEELAGRGAP